MLSVEVKNNKSNHKSLIVVLILLCVVAIVLAVVILLININARRGLQESELEQAGVVLPDELKGDNLSPEDEVIKEVSIMSADPNYNDDDILAYYDNVVAKAISDGNTFLAAKIIIQKMNYIEVSLDNCDGAMSYVNGIDLSSFSAENASYLASYVIPTATTCNNQNAIDIWMKIYMDNSGKKYE